MLKSSYESFSAGKYSFLYLGVYLAKMLSVPFMLHFQ